MFYKVQFTLRFMKIDGGKSPFDFDNKYIDLPITLLLEELIELVNEKLRVKPLSYKQTLNFCDKTGANLTPSSDVSVRTYIYSNPSIARHFEMDELDWSFHSVKSGIFSSVDKHTYSKNHRIFLKINKENLLAELRYFRKNEKKPGESDLDEYFLEKLIIDYIKEVVYALEYIENGNGLSPAEVSDGGIDPFDISLGIGSNMDVDFVLKNSGEEDVEALKKGELFDLMEERVNERARDLFRECSEIYNSQNWHQTLIWFDREMAPYFNKSKNRLYNLFAFLKPNNDKISSQ